MSEPAAPARRHGGGTLVVALGILAIGVFVLWQGWTIGLEQSAYARVGPQVFPYVVGAGLVVVGVLLGLEALRGHWCATWADTGDEEYTDPRDLWRQLGNVVLVGGGLLLNVALIGLCGFVVSSTLMFALTTRAFGSRRPLFDLAVGLAFSGAIYLTFVYALGLPLPAGTLWSSL